MDDLSYLNGLIISPRDTEYFFPQIAQIDADNFFQSPFLPLTLSTIQITLLMVSLIFIFLQFKYLKTF